MRPEQLNITCESDVILDVTLTHDEETLTPSLIENLECNLISGLGKRTALATSLGPDFIVVSIPWVEGRLPGCYSLEIKGSINSLKWCAVGKSLIRYTGATEAGADSVVVAADVYDVTLEAGYYFTDSPISRVEATIDDNVGTPSVDVSYEHKVLGLDFHNMKGNGIESSSEELSDEDGGTNTFTFTDSKGDDHVFHSRNGQTGAKGDTVILGDGVEYTLYNATGQNTNGAMTQKSVTDEINSGKISENNELVWPKRYTGIGGNTDGWMSQLASLDLLNKETIDLSNINEIGYSTDPSKKWVNTYKGKFIPVAARELYLISTQESKPAIILPLKVLTFANNTSYASNIASGFSDRVVVSQDSRYFIEIPSDCHCLYLQTTISGGDITPVVVRLSKGMPEIGLTKAMAHEELDQYTDIENYYINADSKYNSFPGRASRFYKVSTGDVIHMEANDNIATNWCCLKNLNNMTNNTLPALTTLRSVLLTGESVDIVIPPETNYLYVYKSSDGESALPKAIYKYVQPEISQAMTYDMGGSGQTTVLKEFHIAGGQIYRFRLSNTVWPVSSITASSVVFAIYNITESLYITRVIKGENTQTDYYFKADEDTDIRLAYRGDTGTMLSLTVETVRPEDFGKRKYDISFVSGVSTQQSMMVKLGQGDLVRYIVKSDGENASIKAYSRARRDDDYLVESIVLDGGVNEGEYMPKEDVFVVIESVIASGFTPKFEVYNIGNQTNELKYPHQLKFDSANIQTILSTQDEDVTVYDNAIINYGQIIEHNGVYVMLYQGFGSWDNSKDATIMMAYSEDGENWQRGIPEGLPVPYEGTNIIIKAGYQIVGDFTKEQIDNFNVCKVNDADYPYRIFAEIRKSPSDITGEHYWLFKSANLTQWIPISQVTRKGHDTFPSLISYGDYIKAYIRMWDYSQETPEQRRVGVMWMDINGNVIVPPSGLYGPGIYNTAAVRIGATRELAVPTHFYAESGMSGTDEFESYIIDGDKLLYAPSYGLDTLKYPDSNGWAWGTGICAIGMNQYFLYSRRDQGHSSSIQAANVELCLCPIEWVTYDTYNTNS